MQSRGPLTVSGRLEASGNGHGARGGTIRLAAAAGLAFTRDARLEAEGHPDGTISLAAPDPPEPGRARFDPPYRSVPLGPVCGISPLQVPRSHHTATLLRDGTLLLVGGRDATGPLDAIERYSPTSRAFTALNVFLSTPREDHSATLLPDGRILLLGGRSPAGSLLDSGELFDPTRQAVTALGVRLPAPRADHTATLLLDGTVLIAGGTDGTRVLDSTLRFDPAAQTISPLSARLSIPRRGHTATLLPDGRVLLVGGSGTAGPPLDSAELFDPATGTFATLAAAHPSQGHLATARVGHAATLLPDGTVLVLGGTGKGTTSLASGELIEPASGTVSPASTELLRARQDHTATLLGDGSLLITGGVGSGPLGTAERLTLDRLDQSAPRVRDVQPPDLATDVPADSRVAVRFSEPINPATLTPVSGQLFDPTTMQPLDANLAVAEGGLLGFFSPAALLSAGRIYEVRLSTAIQDTGGNPLIPFTSTFSVRAPPQALRLIPETYSLSTGQTAVFTVQLPAPAPGDVLITLESADAAIATLPGSVTIQRGMSEAAVQVAARAPGTVNLTASATGYLPANSILSVSAATLTGLGLGPSNPTLVGGQALHFSATGTRSDGTILDLTGAVSWTSGAPLVAGVSATGLVTAVSPGTTTITATYPGGLLAVTSLTVLPPPPVLTGLEPATLAISPEHTGTLTVTIGAVQSRDTVVSLASSEPLMAAVPAIVTIPAGALSASVSVTGRLPGTVTVTASLSASHVESTVVVSRAAPPLAGLLPYVLRLAPGASGRLTVSLGETPGGETRLAVTSSAPGVVAAPPGGIVTIPAGQRNQTFAVTAVGPGQATITASLNGRTAQAEAVVTAAPPAVVSLEPPILSIAEGGSGFFTLTIDAAQPTDTEVTLASGDPLWVEVPESITIPANSSSVIVPVTGNIASTVIVEAALNQNTIVAAVMVDWTLPRLQAVTCPAAVAVGATGQCRATIHPAQLMETEVHLAAAVPGVLALPDTIHVPANTVEAAFDIVGVGSGSTEIAAGPVTATKQDVTVQVVAPGPTLANLQPAPMALAPGVTTLLTVTLNAAQPTDTLVPLESSTAGVVRVPTGVTVPAGSLTAAIPVTGLAVGTTTVTLGPLNGTQAEGSVTVTEALPTLAEVSAETVTVIEGEAVPLTVTLSAAQPEPTVINLATSDADTVGVPATVTIPAGDLSAPLPVLAWMSGGANVAIGPLSGSSQEVNVTVDPWELLSLAVSPAAATIAVGESHQFMVQGIYNDGTIEDDTWYVTWVSAERDVARIHTWPSADPGMATALSPGATTITAVDDYSEMTTTAILTVTSSVVTSLALTPLVPVRAVGESVAFRVIGTFTDGRTEDLTVTVVWTSSDPAVAIIASPGGLATAIAPGTSTITATYPDGPSASTSVTVEVLAPAVDSLIPSRGRPGMLVSLVGRNLGATSDVRFNGTPATFTVQSITQVNATVPAETTSGPVTVTTQSGTATSSVNFIVTGMPKVAVTSPADGASLTGDSVQVRGSVTTDTEEVGVVVNGLAAQVNGGEWVATVPLQVGSNVLTATATDATSAQVTASVTVTVEDATTP